MDKNSYLWKDKQTGKYIEACVYNTKEFIFTDDRELAGLYNEQFLLENYSEAFKQHEWIHEAL